MILLSLFLSLLLEPKWTVNRRHRVLAQKMGSHIKKKQQGRRLGIGRQTLEEAPGQRGFQAQPPLPGPGQRRCLPLPSCPVRGGSQLPGIPAVLGFCLDPSISKFAARRVPEGRVSPSTRYPSIACLQHGCLVLPASTQQN